MLLNDMRHTSLLECLQELLVRILHLLLQFSELVVDIQPRWTACISVCSPEGSIAWLSWRRKVLDEELYLFGFAKEILYQLKLAFCVAVHKNLVKVAPTELRADSAPSNTAVSSLSGISCVMGIESDTCLKFAFRVR